jgi:pectinesterase inhibitor-like protein
MDFTSKLILFTISLSLLFFVGNATDSPTGKMHIVNRNFLKPDLLDFCKKTTNPTLCENTIQPHFFKRHLDPSEALKVEVDATLNQTQKAIVIINELYVKSGISKSLKDSLDICKEQYGLILDAIKETKDAIATRNWVEARAKFGAVVSCQQACSDSFEGIQKEFTFASDSKAIFDLGGNCLDMIVDLQKSEPQNDPPMTKSPPSPFDNVIGPIN